VLLDQRLHDREVKDVFQIIKFGQAPPDNLSPRKSADLNNQLISDTSATLDVDQSQAADISSNEQMSSPLKNNLPENLEISEEF